MRRILVLVGLLSALVGCARAADPTPATASATTPSATTASATTASGTTPSPSPPSATTPIASDQLPPGVVVATVTADSSGPCYLVETDDGQRYALIGSGGTVHRGQRIRAQTEARPSAVDCGPGIPLSLVKLEIS